MSACLADRRSVIGLDFLKSGDKKLRGERAEWTGQYSAGREDGR